MLHQRKLKLNIKLNYVELHSAKGKFFGHIIDVISLFPNRTNADDSPLLPQKKIKQEVSTGFQMTTFQNIGKRTGPCDASMTEQNTSISGA